jgi:hypothetical protein
MKFIAIGNGKVENISDRTVRRINDKNDYLDEISKCTVAVFPYTSGYNCSLSAAALDALSTGIHIIALDRPFFRNLELCFGKDVITVKSSIDELSSLLLDPAYEHKQEGRLSRINRLTSSKYSITAVQESFEKLSFNQTT